MNGYAKIRFVGTTKSRSMDFSDLLPCPQNPKPNPTSKTQEITKETKTTTTTKNTINDSSSNLEDDQEEANEKKFGEVLMRNSSVSSSIASSNRFKFDYNNNNKQQNKSSSSLESAVKRAFSMRRSSSVSERYCRIYDQSVTLADPSSSSPIIDDGGEDEEANMETVQTRSVKKHRRSKILKACKRLFGL